MVRTTLHFARPNLQPPVYVAGSWDITWTPTEMVGSKKGDDWAFSYDLDSEPGCYQYKFRLGPGDWWIIDETMPTAQDNAGNINNVIDVAQATDHEAHSPVQSGVIEPVDMASTSETEPEPSGPQTPIAETALPDPPQKTPLSSSTYSQVIASHAKDEEDTTPIVGTAAPPANSITASAFATEHTSSVQSPLAQDSSLVEQINATAAGSKQLQPEATSSPEKIVVALKSPASTISQKSLQKPKPRKESFLKRLFRGCFRE